MSDARASTSSASVRPARVLLVDDQDALRRAIARSLTRAGHEVTEARDGSEATQLLGARRFDVVVSDVTMPTVDGVSLLRAVRERDLDLPVVLVTGAPTVETAAEAVEYGALEYLIKPVEPAKLDAVVRRAATLYRIATTKRAAFDLLGHAGPRAGDQAGLEATFERALAGLFIVYQPIVRAATRTLFGYEALMRSVEPALPHPGAVLDAAERLGRLAELGRLLRARSIEPLADAEPEAQLFLNLHPSDLDDDALFDRKSALAGIAGRVIVEITERSSIHDVKDVRARVARLRALGFTVAIDDLGAGYAGLSSFADLEPEIVKLDMSLIRDVDRTLTKQKLVRSMTSLCSDLGMLVVAEGVETEAERDCVVSLGCDLLQGYLFAKPARPFPSWTWGPG